MRIVESIRNAGRKVVEKVFEAPIKNAVDRRFTAAVDRDREDETWRRITHVKNLRDLEPIKQDKMIKIMDWLEDRNPIARKLFNSTTDFVLGDGITIKAEKAPQSEDPEKYQEELQKVIDRFWDVNEWEKKQFTRIKELGKYGENAYKAFPEPTTGLVRLAGIDPVRIRKVCPSKDNAEVMAELWIRPYTTGKDEKLDIMRTDWKVNRIEGEAFFFPVNKGSFGTRGKSDYLALSDWLDHYDRNVYTMTERVHFLLTFLWDIMIKGGNITDLEKKQADMKDNPPKAGSYYIHNDREEMKAVAPDLRGRDFQDFLGILEDVVAGGSGFPKHWLLGKGESANKASAQEMSEPIYRQFKRRQKYVQGMFTFMMDYQVQQSKMLTGNRKTDYAFSVIIPEPSRKEAGQVAEAFAQLMPALEIATMNEFMSNESALNLTSMLANQIGLDIKPEDEASKIKGGVDESKMMEAVQRMYKELNAKEKKQLEEAMKTIRKLKKNQ